MKFIDPYYKQDPTVEFIPTPSQGRSHGGKFTHKSLLSNLSPDNFPINSLGWKSYALGAFRRLGRITKDQYEFIADKLIPDSKIERLSWRMISEMVDAAADQAEKTPTDAKAIISAGHKFLTDKQAEISGGVK